MTIDIEADTGPVGARPAIDRTTSLAPWLVLAALFVAAVWLRHVVAANTDVSWLLIAGERLLDGQRLYRDIIETNPPMAVLVYLPGILIGRALDLPAEMVVDALVLAAVAIALALVGRILRKSSVLEDGQGWPLAWLAVATLTIMPTQAFGQREHIAMVELLPALAILAMRMKRELPPRWAVAIGGLGLGLALSFKPHFAIAILICVGALAFRQKSWRVFFAAELWVAAAVVGSYGVFIQLVFPAYFTVIGPLARDVYVQVGIPWVELMQKPIVAAWALTMFVAMLRMRRRFDDASFLLLFSLSIGFAVVFFVQRKGWPYHALPMMTCAMLAFGYALTLPVHRIGRDRQLTLLGALVLLAIFYRAMLGFNIAFDARPLQAVVARYGPHPIILSISGEAGISHPLTRALGGTWVSREQNIWIAAFGRYLDQHGLADAATRATLERHAATERQWLVEDIRKTPPTVVLVDRLTDDWDGWLRSHPEIADLLKNYRLAETFERIDVLIKRAD